MKANAPVPISCALCGGDTTPWLSVPFDVKSDQETEFGELRWCRSCVLGMTSKIPSPEGAARNYELDAYYTQGQSHLANAKSGLLDRVLIKLAWLSDKCHGLSPDLVRQYCGSQGMALEIGCGSGTTLAMIRDVGFDCVGVEPDPKARSIAEKNGVRVLPGIAEALPEEIGAEKFDLVIMSHALEHCTDPKTAVKNAWNALRPGGVFMCEVPNCGAVYFQDYDQISEMLDVPRHLFFFTKQSLTELCRRAGIEIVDWYYNGFTRHHTPHWRAWENGIHDRLAQRGMTPTVPRHSLLRSFWTLLRSFAASPSKKYDCIGLIARKV